MSYKILKLNNHSHIIVVVGEKSMCLAAASGVAVAAAKLLLVRWESRHMLKILTF